MIYIELLLLTIGIVMIVNGLRRKKPRTFYLILSDGDGKWIPTYYDIELTNMNPTCIPVRKNGNAYEPYNGIYMKLPIPTKILFKIVEAH